jgi:hypothetical protein
LAPAGAWPAELVGIAQPAMRRVLARTPQEPEPGSRWRHAAGPCCTTREGNAHRTDKSDEREVLYPWHPWAGCTVYVHETVEKTDGTALRCSRDGGATERWLELPVWMFDRAACLLMRIARDPHVDLAALSVLQALIAEAAECSGQILSSNSPVSGAAREPRDQNPGDAHATPKPLSCERSQASPSARSVRSAAANELRWADPGLADAPRRGASDGDRPDGAASARARPRRSLSQPDGASR